MTTSSRPLQAIAPTRGHPHRQVWIVFALVWAVMVGYGRSDFRVRVFNIELTKATLLKPAEPTDPAELAQPLLGAQETEPVAVAISPGDDAVDSRATRPAVDQGSQRILMIGDSMVEKLMLRFADYCHHNGHAFQPAIWYASTTSDWAGDSKLTQLIADFKPTFVIVVVGSSDLTRRRIDLVEPAIRSIVKRIGSRKFVWVGPPNWRQDTGINALLARTVGEGHFFRSADLHFERASDGIHPTRESSAAWMDAIARWVVDGSDVPIVLDHPTTSAPRPAAQVFPPPR